MVKSFSMREKYEEQKKKENEAKIEEAKNGGRGKEKVAEGAR